MPGNMAGSLATAPKQATALKKSPSAFAWPSIKPRPQTDKEHVGKMSINNTKNANIAIDVMSVPQSIRSPPAADNISVSRQGRVAAHVAAEKLSAKRKREVEQEEREAKWQEADAESSASEDSGESEASDEMHERGRSMGSREIRAPVQPKLFKTSQRKKRGW